jgi:hypothetical protein
MSWMHDSKRTSARQASHADNAKEAILASVYRGLFLPSASRRLQDSISSQRASAEAHHLLTDAKELCEDGAGLGMEDGRVRVAIESLTGALEPSDRTDEQ